MSELIIVLRREFVERVRTKSFILSTILIPVFMSLMFIVPILMETMRSGETQELVIVDESPPEVGDRIVASLSEEPASDREDRFVVDRLRVPLATVQDSLNEAVLAETIDGYLWIPPDIVQSSEVGFRSRSVTDMDVQQQIGEAVTSAVRGARLRDAGLQVQELSSLLQPVEIDAASITREGEEGASGITGMMFSLVVGFILYFLILIYGVQVMQSVQEEKTNRIAEVLVSSMKASHLMLGKVLGVGFVALLQVVIWAVCAVILVTQRSRVAEALGTPPGMLDSFSLDIDPLTGVALGMFSILGFFLYAALFAAAGAAAESSEDAQRFTFPLIMPLIIPMFTFQAIMSSPEGTLATVLGWIPFTSPLVMPMRMGAGGTSTPEIAGTLLLLIVSVVGLTALAGKIYRIGILSTGKRPTVREMMTWLRAS